MSKPALHMVDGDGPEDAVTRRRKFEDAHPGAVILPPSAGRWRAVVDGRTFGSYDLGGLLDQLDELYTPPDITPLTTASRRAGTCGGAGRDHPAPARRGTLGGGLTMCLRGSPVHPAEGGCERWQKQASSPLIQAGDTS